MKQSLLIREQFPQFIKDNYDQFISFIEAYYEFLEQGNNSNQILLSGNEIADIDSTIDLFVDNFMSTFATNIPSYISADKRLFLKHANDIFSAKGTEKSYKLLFNILNGSSTTKISYPKQYILKASDGLWSQERSIKILAVSGDPFELEGKIITGQTTGAKAAVEKVFSYQSGTNFLYELFLNFQSIEGSFAANETISSNGISGSIIPVVTKINIQSKGTGYTLNDNILISGVGYDALAKITDVSDTGQITSVKIYNFGSGWSSIPTVSVSGGNSDAVLTASIGALCVYPGQWIGNNGKVSDVMKIFDGYYYQNYSYVIRTSTEIGYWRDIVKEILHPAGMQMFGELFSFTNVTLRAFAQGSSNTFYGSSIFKRLILLIGASVNYQSVSVSTEVSRQVSLQSHLPDYNELKKHIFDLNPDNAMVNRGSFSSGVAYNKNDVVLDTSNNKYYRCIIPYTSDALTPVASINWSRWNHTFPDTINANYFDLYSNYQIKDFGYITIQDWMNNHSTPIQIEPYTSITK